MYFYVGKGGGSEDINILKSSCVSFNTLSKPRSKSFNQDCIKCTFYKKIQLPFLAHAFNNSIAFSS